MPVTILRTVTYKCIKWSSIEGPPNTLSSLSRVSLLDQCCVHIMGFTSIGDGGVGHSELSAPLLTRYTPFV